MSAFHAVRASLLPLTLVGLALHGESPPARSIRSLRHEIADGVTRLVVEADGPLRYDYLSPDPTKAVVEIHDVEACALPPQLDLATPEVRSVRITETVGEEGRRGCRIEVALTAPLHHRIVPQDHALHLVFTRPPDAPDGEPHRDSTPATAAPVAEAAPAVVLPESRGEAPKAGVPGVEAPLASRVTGISVAREQGQIAIMVSANGRLQHEDFLLEAPDRVVLDFFGVVNEAPRGRLQVGLGAVLAVRLVQHQARPTLITRLVVDLESRVHYTIADAADGLSILIEDPRNAQ